MRANIPVLLKINANYPLRSNLTECAMSSPEHLQQAPDLIERNNDDYYHRCDTMIFTKEEIATDDDNATGDDMASPLRDIA